MKSLGVKSSSLYLIPIKSQLILPSLSSHALMQEGSACWGRVKDIVSSLTVPGSSIKVAVWTSDGPTGGVWEIASRSTYYTLAPPQGASYIRRSYGVDMVSAVGSTVESK